MYNDASKIREARAMMDRGDFTGALRSLQKLRAVEPRTLDIEVQYIRCHLELGHLDSVASALRDSPQPRDLISAIREFIARRDEKNVTLLHYTVVEGAGAAAAELIAQGADANARDKVGMTPLHWAVQGGWVGPVRVLLQCGADINARDRDDETPLFCAQVGLENERIGRHEHPEGLDPQAVYDLLVSCGAKANRRKWEESGITTQSSTCSTSAQRGESDKALRSRARGMVPSGCIPTDEKITPASSRVVRVAASSEGEAQRKVSDQIVDGSAIGDMTLAVEGRKRLFGFGRKQSEYDVELRKPRVVAITYRAKAPSPNNVADKFSGAHGLPRGRMA